MTMRHVLAFCEGTTWYPPVRHTGAYLHQGTRCTFAKLWKIKMITFKFLMLLNPSKTDFLWCATHRRCNQLSTVSLEVCGVRVPPTDTVWDLGILLEADMQMTCHARQLVSRCSAIWGEGRSKSLKIENLFRRSRLFCCRTAVLEHIHKISVHPGIVQV